MSNSNTNTKFQKDVDIDKVIRSLKKKNGNKPRSTYVILEELKKEFKSDDELIDKIMEKYQKDMVRVTKIAFKIHERLLQKYPHLSQKELIEKVARYKEKYHLDDSDVQIVINMIFSGKNDINRPEGSDYNYSAMSKALGFVPASYNLTGELNVKPDEMESLQDILKLDAFTKELHNQIILQSLVYQPVTDNVGIELTSFERSKINIFSFVHPVIFALFIPKIKLLDNQMLIASLSNIISQKWKGEDIKSLPEYELYYNIATDPADLACFSKPKPFKDLLYRCEVQAKLWDSVLNLRQKKFYIDNLSSFIQAVDNCRASVFDAADLAFVKDEGTILRKLFAAFSLRPTVVKTTPVQNIIISNQGVLPTYTSGHVTQIPMVTMRLASSTSVTTPTLELTASFDQQQLYLQGNQLVVKTQVIIYSREILIFYVHRRNQGVDFSKLGRPYGCAFLPLTIGAFDKLNDLPIIFHKQITTFNSQIFTIKSIVTVETNDIDKEEIIIGSNALVNIDNANPDDWVQYQPLIINANNSSIMPVSKITWDETAGTKTCSKTVLNEGSRKGTIFLYHTEVKECVE